MLAWVPQLKMTSEGKKMPVDQLADAVSDVSVDERALVRRVATGDRSALESLYHRYYPRLASFLWRSIGRREGVEQLINDTFIEAWRGSCDCREGSLAVSTWIFGIAYRKALEHLCQQWSSAAWTNQRRSSEEFIDPVNDTEMSEWLRQGLGTMPFEQRSTLILAYQMGCAPEEIAAITSAPIGTIKARMLRARETLRDFLPGGNTGVAELTSTDERV
jgi:RNA polymerase sigma-70 factor (ECF subfamily)